MPVSTLHRSRLRSFDGTRLAVQRAGDTGPLVVLANGLGGNMRAWPSLVAELAPRYRVVSWDYRGLYGSAPPPDPAAVRIEDHRRDLEVLLDHMGGGPAALVGWSMGVQVAVDAALARPDRVAGLVLVCGAPGDPFAGVLRTRTSRAWVPAACRLVEAAPGPFGTVVRRLAAWPAAPEVLRRAGIVAPSCDLGVLHDLAGEFSRLDWRTYARTMRAMGRHDAWSLLERIRAPALVIGGTRDLFTPPSAMARLAASIPGAELLMVEGATHYAPLEFPGVLDRAIARFLDHRARWPRMTRRGGSHVVEPV